MSKHVGKGHIFLHRLKFGISAFIVLELIIFVVVLLSGKNFAVLNPKGFIASAQSNVILLSAAILFTIAIPTLVILYFVAWKYRETNTHAEYDPQENHGKMFDFGIWAIPSFFMLLMAFVMIPATHRLDPRQQISSYNKPLTIQVIAMRWKWVFLYPDQNIATVNFVQIPTDTPVEFELSADESPMSSFWIPNLGGQLYAMTGHVNTLHLLADKPGDYAGSTAELTGAGFSGMKFVARASSQDNFDSWVNEAKNSPSALTSEEYAHLLKPSEHNAATLYAKTDPELFSTMLAKYAGSHDHGMHE
ncbi:MAG: COX aromatic rich motif-containing protein [Patescibacteria group bacterium]|nr:COX aromatic rich motif-containing protein [Patescibacteria group bacterium]